MEIIKTKNGSQLTVELVGRLDTTTAPSFEAVIKNELADVTDLVLEFKNLEYVSSAGLRVILLAQKTMDTKGQMVVQNVAPSIYEIFEITGFSSVLNVKN